MPLQDVHPDENEHVCEVCNTAFESEAALGQHVSDMGFLH
jgi:hypothetical protein